MPARPPNFVAHFDNNPLFQDLGFSDMIETAQLDPKISINAPPVWMSKACELTTD